MQRRNRESGRCSELWIGDRLISTLSERQASFCWFRDISKVYRLSFCDVVDSAGEKPFSISTGVSTKKTITSDGRALESASACRCYIGGEKRRKMGTRKTEFFASRNFSVECFQWVTNDSIRRLSRVVPKPDGENRAPGVCCGDSARHGSQGSYVAYRGVFTSQSRVEGRREALSVFSCRVVDLSAHKNKPP